MTEIYLFTIKDRRGLPYLVAPIRSVPDSNFFTINGPLSTETLALLDKNGPFSGEFKESLQKQGPFRVYTTKAGSVGACIHGQTTQDFRYFGTGGLLETWLELVNEDGNVWPITGIKVDEAVRMGYTNARFNTGNKMLTSLSPRLSLNPVWA